MVALDRLGRSLSGVIRTLDELTAADVLPRSLREGIDYATPAGKILAGIFAALAGYERDLMRERAAAARQAARARGQHVGRTTPPHRRRLGDPEVIAHQAYEEAGLTMPTPQRRLGITEILALILLPTGSLLIPVLGWIATRRQKIAGTLLPPLGLAFPLLGGLLLLRLPQAWVTGTCSGTSSNNFATQPFTCTGGGWGPTTILIVCLAIASAATLLAITVPIRLGQKARRPSAW